MKEAKYTLGNQDVDTSVLTLEMTWRGIIEDKDIKKDAGLNPPHSFLEPIKGQTITYFVVASELEQFIPACANALLNKKDLIEKLKQKTIKSTRNIREYAKKYIDKIENLTDEEMGGIFEESACLQAQCMADGTIVAFADIYGEITNSLLAIIKKRGNLKYPLHVYTNVLGNPSEKSLTQQAYLTIQKNNNSNQDLLKDYFWLDQGYIGRGLTNEQLEEIKEESGQEETLPNAGELFEELNLTNDERRAFFVSQEIIAIKSLRADSRQFLHVVNNKMADVLAERWNLEPKLVEVMYAHEITRVLRGSQEIPRDLAKRWTHSILLRTEESTKYKVLSGAKADEFMEVNVIKEKSGEKKEVKGQTAQPGKVTGIVRLVFGPQHNNKVKDGEILISTATSPQLLPAMKRAAAFVTDVGGITSHAAIVARELKKPCVVGTKNATKIFHDGDRVEVDADSGTIKIIDRN